MVQATKGQIIHKDLMIVTGQLKRVNKEQEERLLWAWCGLITCQ